MKLNQPTKKWQAQRIAILDSLAEALSRRVQPLNIAYFAALGFFVFCWVQSTFWGVQIASGAHVFAVIVSILVLLGLGPALLSVALVVRMINQRMND